MKIKDRDFFSDDLKDTSWLGEVMDVEDPDTLGRIKVKVFGKFDELSTEDIPWCYPGNNMTSGSNSGGGFYSVPKLGSIVSVRFDNGNIYHPEYFFKQRISNELQEEIKPNPTNFHSLIYDSDENLKIYYTQDKGLMLEYLDSQINMRPDNTIYIEHKGGMITHIQDKMISLGSETESDEPAVLGEKNVDALTAITDQVTALSGLLQTFCQTQTVVCTQIKYLGPLLAGYTSLNVALPIQIDAIDENPIKTITIPQTRSSKVSLDGPPIMD